MVLERSVADSCALAHYTPVTVSSLHTSVSISIKGILCIIYTVIKYLQATFLLSPSRLHSAEIAVWKYAQLVTFAGIPHRAETLCSSLTGKHKYLGLFFFSFFFPYSFEFLLTAIRLSSSSDSRRCVVAVSLLWHRFCFVTLTSRFTATFVFPPKNLLAFGFRL